LISDNFKSVVFQSIGWTALDSWGNRLFSFVVIAVLTRLLDAEVFGILAAALIFSDYLELFVSQGIGYAIVQRKEVEAEHLNCAFWLNAGSGGVLAFLLWVGAPQIADLFNRRELVAILESLSPLLFISGISRIQTAILAKELRFKELAIRNLSGQIAGGAAGVFLAYQGYGVWSLVWQLVVKSVISSAVLWFSCNWRPGFSMSLRHAKDLYAYSIKIMADQQVLYFSNRFDEGLIAYFLDTTSLGYYSVGKRLVMIFFDLFNSTIGTVVFPLFAKIHCDTRRLNSSFTLGVRFYLAVTVPVFLGIAAFSTESIQFVFGSHWESAAPVAVFIAISGPFQFAPIFIHSIFQATGGPGVSLFLNTLRAAFGLVLFPVGSLFGMLGVAAAYMLKGLLAAFADLFVFKIKMRLKVGKILWQNKQFVFASLGTLIFSKLIHHFLLQVIDPRIAFVLTAIISAITYVFAVVVLDNAFIKEVKELLINIKGSSPD
jgi:O-antigen/teichoic acid export membrane protein